MNDHLKKDTLIRLSTLAERTGVSVHCIRTYVDQGLIRVNDRTAGGLLLFDETAIVRLHFIRTARAAGVPLGLIVRLLAASDKGDNEGTKISLTELNQYIQDIRSKVNVFEQNLSQFETKIKLDVEIL